MTTTAIFGPFLRVSKATLVMFNLDESPKKETKFKVIKFVFLLIALAPIVVLSYFVSMEIQTAKFFTINWAWIYIFTFLSMQGIFSIVILYNKNRKQYFEKYTKKLMLLTKDPETLDQNKIKQSQLFMGIFMVYFFFCVGCSGVVNVIEYGNTMANLTNSTNTTNVTGQFRQSIFENLDLFFINLVVTFWSTFISGIALALMILSYKPIVEIYTKFNKDLKKSFEELEFDPHSILIDIEPYLNHLLDLIQFNNKAWENLVSHTFMVGFIMAMMSFFLTRSFSIDASVPTNVMMYSFMVLSIMFLIISTKYPSDLYSKLIETQNIILSNEILTRKESDKLISSIDILIKKLQKPTLSVHFFNCFKITKKTMSLSMFIIWILTEYFHAYRNVEP